MYEYVSRDRVKIGTSLTEKEIDELIHDSELDVLQFSEPLDEALPDALNERFFAHRPDVWLRVYGHYAEAADLRFLARMTHVTKLSLDCLMDAANLDAIAHLCKLEALRLDIYQLNSLDVLYDVPDSLDYLHIGKTKSKKPDLYAIQRFGRLRTLEIYGQNRNIDAIRYLKQLDTLAIGSTTLDDVSYLASLPKLRSLELSNLGLRDMHALATLTRIEQLKLWNAKLPGDLSFISGLNALQELTLEAMASVEELPKLSNLRDLRSIRLENMKNLKRLDELEDAPALEEFAHYFVAKLTPAHFLPVLRNPSVRKVNLGFQSAKKYEAFEKLAVLHGKTPRSWYR
ncbi:hypothetical protein ACFFSY_19390 [Paenibacillus aurantiacus]|uniref:Leucine-rich repeat domain-containing protein n=1 Tax=Paenibacillus aurantiacus TaxID=1936118 RepID=A0ABV5KSA8_9BACL